MSDVSAEELGKFLLAIEPRFTRLLQELAGGFPIDRYGVATHLYPRFHYKPEALAKSDVQIALRVVSAPKAEQFNVAGSFVKPAPSRTMQPMPQQVYGGLGGGGSAPGAGSGGGKGWP